MPGQLSENLNPRIMTSDPDMLWGSVAFKGTRVHIRTLFDYLADGKSLDEFLEDFPTVTREQAIELIETASNVLTSSVSIKTGTAV